MSKPTRRQFIQTSAATLGAGLVLPVINRTARGTTVVKQLHEDLVGNGNILVIVELAGGNDGLNTIVPLAQYNTYASFRTRIAIPKEQVLPLYGTTTMGMTPNFNAIKPIVDAGKFAVVQAVHYPNANLSHDGSRTIYYRGDPSTSTVSSDGWVGRHSALFGSHDNALDTVGIGGVSKTLYSPGAKVSGIGADAEGNASGYQFSTDARYQGDRNNQINAARLTDTTTSPLPYLDLVETTNLDALNSSDQVATATATYQSNVAYPEGNSFASGLKLIAKLATATPTLGTRVFYITLGGFDTHANQLIDQPDLHQQLANGLKSFYEDMVAHGISNRVMVMVWSEFGRRVADNASEGTDHGTANNIYLLGDRVKGGTYGADPSLTDLSGGNLKMKVDFRDVYTTIIQNWFGNSPSEAASVLNGNFTNLGFVA
jgi:uncharacterized protein (DUF1501 family)